MAHLTLAIVKPFESIALCSVPDPPAAGELDRGGRSRVIVRDRYVHRKTFQMPLPQVFQFSVCGFGNSDSGCLRAPVHFRKIALLEQNEREDLRLRVKYPIKTDVYAAVPSIDKG